MTKNYARESGTFMALAKMFRDAANEMALAQNDFDRVWATRNLMMLAKQTDEALIKYGYEQKEVDTV
jgi:hypothetical protein